MVKGGKVKPKILDRYIIKEMTGPFFIGLAVYSFLFLVNLIFQLANLVIQQGLSAWLGGLLFALSLPNLLAYTIPVALLLGTIIAFGKLSSESEIIALKAGGIKERRLLVPPLIFGLIVTFVILFFNLWLVPRCRQVSEDIQDRSARAVNLMRLIHPGVFFDRIPGVLLFAKGVDPSTGRFDKVLVYQQPKPSVDVLTMADSGRTTKSPEGGVDFILEDGETVQFDRKHPGRIQRSSFDLQTLAVGNKTPSNSTSTKNALSEYPTGELIKRIGLKGSDTRAAAPGERNGYKYELNRRFAVSIAALFFVLIGVPLGLVNVRGGKGAGFSLSLIVLLGYWILGSALGDLAIAGRMNPELAAWLPDVVLLGVGLWLLGFHRKRAAIGWLTAFLKLFPERKTTKTHRTSAHRAGIISILDRYIFKRAARFFILVCISILLLDWLIEARGLSEFVTGRQKVHLLFKYLFYQSPGVLVMLLPFVVLITVLTTYGILERSNEIMAAKASGISLYRLAMPALVIGLIASGASWIMGEYVVPHASRVALTTKDSIKNYATRNVGATIDVWLFAPDQHILFHYRHYNSRKDSFKGFSFYRLKTSEFRLQSRLYAKKVKFRKPGEIEFKKAWRWSSTAKKSFKIIPSGTLPFGFSKSYFMMPSYREGILFNSKDLLKLIENMKAKGYPYYRQKMDYYKKYTDSAAPFILLLIGLPFAFMTGRKGSLYGISIALSLVIAYYAIAAVFQSVGVMQWLDPALAAWTPTVLFGLAGGYFLLNLRT